MILKIGFLKSNEEDVFVDGDGFRGDDREGSRRPFEAGLGFPLRSVFNKPVLEDSLSAGDALAGDGPALGYVIAGDESVAGAFASEMVTFDSFRAFGMSSAWSFR